MIEFSKTQTDKLNSDEFYTPYEIVIEHIKLSEKYLGLSNKQKVATAFGKDNIYTKVLSDQGYDVKDFPMFEDFISSGETDRVLIDNPPFSRASKDRKILEENGFKYSLLGSGTRFPKSHKHGVILMEQPRIYYHNNISVLTSIFTNMSDLVFSEYPRKIENKYDSAFIAMNLVNGTYTRDFLKENGMNL